MTKIYTIAAIIIAALFSVIAFFFGLWPALLILGAIIAIVGVALYVVAKAMNPNGR